MMAQFKFFIFCACITYSVAAAVNSRNSDYGYPYNHVSNPSESYIGPSSYATSFNAKEYPETGNFGALLNLKNPSISSTYTTYGPSGNNDFGSTTHINYPPSAQPSGSPNININWPSFSPHDSSKINYLASSHEPSFNGHPSAHEGSSSYEETLKAISQHVEITKPIAVPIYKKFPFAVNKKFPVAIPHPILVPVPAPYPVNIQVSQPIAVPIIREIKIPVEKEVLYPVEKRIPIKIDKPFDYKVEKIFPVYVSRPFPVKIPIIKTIIHKSPKKH